MSKIKLPQMFFCALRRISLVALFSIFAAFAAAAQGPNSAANQLDALTVVTSDMAYGLDPHLGTYHTEAQIQGALYEGLFTYGPDAAEPQGALATSFRISRDKLRWTFTLREDATWSDGSKITANDVRESWLNLLALKDAPYSSMLDVVAGAQEYREGKGRREDVAISAQNDTTLTVRLTEPTGHFLHILCHNSLAAVKPDLSIYSGPFVLESKKADSTVLLKNENYWDKENVKLSKITILQTSDETEATYFFNTGKADWIIENADAAAVLNKNSVQISAEFASLYLFFKNKGGVASNRTFRSALLEAVPWEEIRSGFLIPATTLVYPLAGYPQVTGYSYTDETEAQILMAQARRELNIPAGKKITLTFAIGSNMEYMRNIATILNDAWKPLGVEVAPLNVRGDYFGSIASLDADIFMYNWIGDFGDPVAFLELFRGNSSLNMSGWKNAEFDSLLSQAAHLENSERYKLLSDAEQIIIDSAEIIPISHMVAVNVIDLNSVGGWATNAINVHPFKFMFKRKITRTMPGII